MRSESPWPYDDFVLTDLQSTGENSLYVFRTHVLQAADQTMSLSTGKPLQKMLLCFDAIEARLIEYLLPSLHGQIPNRSYDGDTWGNRVCPMLWKSLEIRAGAMLYFSTMSGTDS